MTLQDPRVTSALERFICAQIEHPREAQLARFYNVERAPAFIFLGADSYTRARLDGEVSARQLLEILNRQTGW